MIIRYTTRQQGSNSDFTIYVGTGGLAGQSIFNIDFKSLFVEIVGRTGWFEGKHAVEFTENLKHVRLVPHKSDPSLAHVSYIINQLNKEICSAYIEWLAEQHLIEVNHAR